MGADMLYSPMHTGDPPTDVLGVWITYQEHELDALGHVLEYLRKRFGVSEEDLANKKKLGRILLRHPLCQILDKQVSLPKLLSQMFDLEDISEVTVAVGFRFKEDRTTFRVYQQLLAKTRDKDLKSTREVYEKIFRHYFPDKEKMN